MPINFTHLIDYLSKKAQTLTPNVASMNQAISVLNSKKSQIKNAEATSGIDKIINYLSWFRTIGTGGNVNYQGKEDRLPTDNEIIQIIKTKLFDKNFITSLLLLIGKDNLIVRIDSILNQG